MKTDKFNNMISAFQCDFSQARDSGCSLSSLDCLIKDKDSKIHRDIDLLEELEYLLRAGKAEIHIKGE